MGKPALPQSKSPLLKALPCPAPIINMSWTETPLFGTQRRDLHARFLAHTFVQQLYTRSARTGTWHAFTWNTHVNHKPTRNSQNHNISLVILLGLLPTPASEPHRHLTSWFWAFGHPHSQQPCNHILTIYNYFSLSFLMVLKNCLASMSSRHILFLQVTAKWWAVTVPIEEEFPQNLYGKRGLITRFWIVIKHLNEQADTNRDFKSLDF